VPENQARLNAHNRQRLFLDTGSHIYFQQKSGSEKCKKSVTPEFRYDAFFSGLRMVIRDWLHINCASTQHCVSAPRVDFSAYFSAEKRIPI